MTQTTDPHDTDGGCEPLRLDFDKLSALIAVGEDKRPFPARLRTVEHALGHLREETGLDDQQIGRVLLTLNVLLSEIVTELGPKWNGVACANWLALCGRRLWEEGQRVPVLTRLAQSLGIGRRDEQDGPEAGEDAAEAVNTDA